MTTSDPPSERWVAGSARDAASRDWVADLTATGHRHDDAVADLHDLLRRAAHTEAAKRSGINGIRGRELEDLADQAANDAVVSVLRRVGDFRGDSRFTTWAYKFVVLEVSSKVGRHVWRRDGVAFEAEDWAALPARIGAAGSSPQDHVEERALLDAVREAVSTELTPHQRRVFVAVVLNGSPLDAVTAALDTNRNAIYKTVFDARRKIRTHLESCGLLPPGGAR